MTGDHPTGWTRVEKSERIMATHISVHVATLADRRAEAEAQIDACLAFFRSVDATLSRFDGASELSRVNAAPTVWHTVSPMLFDVLAESIAAARATGGLFDPALLPLLTALGYDRDFSLFAYTETHRVRRPHARPATTSTWAEIEMDATHRRIRLPTGAQLDFGGIAKGWAADVALERFFPPDASVLLNLGGDMRARGEERPGEPWPIGIGDPHAGDGLKHRVVVGLRSGGIATSGGTLRWWYRDGMPQHHIVDPRSRQPAQVWLPHVSAEHAATTIATATALAPTAGHAEVAAKVALLRGYPDCLHAVRCEGNGMRGGERHAYAPYGDTEVALIVILGSGEVVCSENVAAYLRLWGGSGEIWML